MNNTINNELKNAAYNMHVLNNRVSHQKLINVNGRLKPLNFLQNLFCFISPKYNKQIQKGVNHAICAIIEKIDDQSLSLSDKQIKELVINKLFRLNYNIYRPQDIYQNRPQDQIDGLVANLVREEIELHTKMNDDINLQKLDQSMKDIKDKLQELSKKPSTPIIKKEIRILKTNLNHLSDYRKKLVQALASIDLGLHSASNGSRSGWSEAYFLRDPLTGKTIGVYKPSDKDSHSPKSPKFIARVRYFVFSLFFLVVNTYVTNNVGSFYKTQVGRAHIAEKSADILSTALQNTYEIALEEGMALPFRQNAPLVPKTDIIEIEHDTRQIEAGKGSLQIFVDNPQNFTDFLGIDKNYIDQVQETPEVFKKRLEDKNILGQYQWLMAFHYIVGAQDAHAENILVAPEENGQISVYGIDNGMSLPSNPVNNMSSEEKRRFMEGCKLPLAEHSFLAEFGPLLQKFEDEYLSSVMDDIQKLYLDPENYPSQATPDSEPLAFTRVQLMRERLLVLKEMVKRGTPLKELLPK